MIKTIAIVLTACGIETIRLAQLLIYRLIRLQQHLPPAVLKLVRNFSNKIESFRWLQQHLPLAVCAEGCETAEEQSDDEVRTSQVPERREGKTKAINKCTTVYSIETPTG